MITSRILSPLDYQLQLPNRRKILAIYALALLLDSVPCQAKRCKLLKSVTGWVIRICSDPSFESDPSNEYSLLRLTQVMNSIFLDPSDEFLTQVVNIGIHKQILGFCFHFSKRDYKIGYELTREDFTGGCQCSDQLPRHGRG